MKPDIIEKVNQIQDLFSTLGHDPIEFPKIVVVGTQSAGKSSVLESIVQRSFLPRGTGTVTRCPLVLHLLHCPLADPLRKRKGTTELKEWGEFLHAEGEIFDLDAIRAEIERQTDKLAGSNKGIVKNPITLRIYSPDVLNLTLVDLPGITKVPVGDQPADIEQQIHRLVNEYINNELSIILAVVTANTDMATNESLKLARDVDPEGKRTLAVVTKLDLMDAGTDARDILNGKVIPVKLGIIGVKNRSQKHINDNKSIKEAIDDEKKFLQETYPDLAARHGTFYLSKKLSDLLLSHVHDCLPEVKGNTLDKVERCREELAFWGASVVYPKETLTNVLVAFNAAFCSRLEGGHLNFEKETLAGGAKICYFLHNSLERAFARINPCETYSLETVLMGIRNSNGVRPPMFVAEQVFENLLKPQLKRMEQPALKSLIEVKTVLKEMARESLPEALQRRFPRLKRELLKIMSNIIEDMATKAEQMVKDLVEMETEHITYNSLKQATQEELTKMFSETEKAPDEYGLPFRRKNMKPNSYKSKPSLSPSSSEPAGTLVIPTNELLKVTDKDCRQIMFLGTLLQQYFQLVSSRLQDSVAQAVVCFLVNKARNQMQTRLSMELGKEGVLETLFEEDADVSAKRRETEKTLQVLEESLVILNDLSDGT